MKVTYHGRDRADWCPLLMANISHQSSGLGPFFRQTRNLGNSASQSQWWNDACGISGRGGFV